MADPAPTILLVDDEDAVRKVLAFPLERDGYEVIQAADGEEALQRFAQQPIDLVVLDITLPFSIREFRSRVRALLRRARAPHGAVDVVEEVIEHEGLRIDVPRRIVEVRGSTVQLTYVEFELLRALAAQPGRVFSRRMLL